MFWKRWFDTRPWYVGHIILLVSVAFIGGHYIQEQICTLGFCMEQIKSITTMILVNLGWYSLLAYLVDNFFHKITRKT